MRQIYYFFADAARIALQSIWSQKLRAFLTLLGVIFGVASVVVMGASISGFNNYIVSTIGRILGNNHFMIARFAHQGEWTEEDWDRAFKRNKRLRWEDYEWMLTNCKDCEEVGANVNTSVNLKYQERELFGTNIVGVTASMGQIENKTISEGRFIAAHEVEQFSPRKAILLVGEIMSAARHEERLDLLAVAAQRLGHRRGLCHWHVLVPVSVDQQYGRIDLRHAQDRRAHRPRTC